MSNKNGVTHIYLPFQWLEDFCNSSALNKAIDLNKDDAFSAWETAAKALGKNEFEIAHSVAEAFGLQVATLPAEVDRELLSFIPKTVADEYLVFPLEKADGKLYVASSHPAHRDMLSMLGFLTLEHIEPRIAPPELISEWINLYYPGESDSEESVVIRATEAATGAVRDDGLANDSAIVEIVSHMLVEAFTMNASDVHVEPYRNGGLIRYRIDGLLREITELPKEVLVPVVQRIKAISRLNLAKKMVPQDGSVSLEMRGQEVDLRVSTLPVKGGEKVVIRLLIKSSVGSIKDIGLPPRELRLFKEMLQNSDGIFVITGPTGSGKTSTLYAALKELNTPERCLVTVEDPVEYEVDGIAQISINPAQNLTFYSALRSILRQDPDVILMGEVRDEETAEITFRAAITGHFVLTTLHTSDAITTIPRLLGLGIPETIVADSLRGMASQRLVRKLCPTCAREGGVVGDTESERFLRAFPDANIKSPVGCEECGNSGYKGRMPLFEIITMNPELADAIRAKKDTRQLRDIAFSHTSRPICDVAAEAIANGQTSAKEIHRVLGESFWKGIEKSVAPA